MAMGGWFENRLMPSGTKVRLVCEECGRAFWLPPSKTRMYTTCSPTCVKARAIRVNEAITTARGRECKVCGANFLARQSQIAAGRGLFCSHKCQGAFTFEQMGGSAGTYARQIGGVSDRYVKQLLGAAEPALRSIEIPSALISAKRAHLLIQRQLERVSQ